MGKRAVLTLVIACVMGFGGFGILAADAANPVFNAVVNPLSQLPASAVLEGTTCTSSSSCVAVGFDLGSQPLTLAGDPSSWGTAQVRVLGLGALLNQYGDGSVLLSVTCTSPTSCVAVGEDGNDQPLVLTGDPATWTASHARQITLGGALGSAGLLTSVACTSSTACVAVGSDGRGQPLALVGDPASWTAAQAREMALGAAFGEGGSLASVTCTSSSACVAVGRDRHRMPIVVSGNPSAWVGGQVQEIPLGAPFGWGGSLSSIACTTSSACIAVGGDGHSQPFMLAGDPSTWSVAQANEIKLDGSFGASGSLLSVTCTTISSCVAVGYDGRNQPLMVAGDPSTPWTGAQAADVVLGNAFSAGGELTSISCVSSSDCVAAGIDNNEQPLVFGGDPATWGAAQAQEMTLHGAAFGAETSPSTLTCTSNTSCLELGLSYNDQDGSSAYLIQGNPATWDLASAVPMTGISPNSSLNGNACPSPTFCVAVGQDGVSEDPLVLTGDPSTWGSAGGRVIALSNALGGGGVLFGVACTSTTSCVAVGVDYNDRPLVLKGNPSTWTSANAVEFKLSKALQTYGALNSIACTSVTACVAVGSDGFGNKRQPLVLVGNPSTWKATNLKKVTLTSALGGTGTLFSVACASSTSCVTAGYAGKGPYKPLVLTGKPGGWTVSKAFNLKVPAVQATSVGGLFGSGGLGAGSGYLLSTSCHAANYCVVVGGDGVSAPVYMSGNPTTWKGHALRRPTKHGSSFTAAQLATSSCTATACFAGGVANGGDFVASITGG
jgi:hypothetical protein